MAYVLDIAVVIVFGLMVYFGHRDGFIKTLAGTIAFVVALVLSSVLAGPVSEIAYDKLVEPPVVTAAMVEETTEETQAPEILEEEKPESKSWIGLVMIAGVLGIVFGVAPALRAAGMLPVDALKTD